MKQAGIYVNDVFCGILTEDEEGFHFLYDKTYLVRPNAAPVSPTMPLTEMRSRGR
jgi:serine/threonine-protein kinase HipA